MFESIIIFAIIMVCAFFVGRRFYRQWRIATDKSQDISCSDSCSCCANASCDSRPPTEQ